MIMIEFDSPKSSKLKKALDCIIEKAEYIKEYLDEPRERKRRKHYDDDEDEEEYNRYR